ncbi:MAG TPA: hypothetical protein VIL20_30485 [Sandaracinaceae bacterium]
MSVQRTACRYRGSVPAATPVLLLVAPLALAGRYLHHVRSDAGSGPRYVNGPLAMVLDETGAPLSGPRVPWDAPSESELLFDAPLPTLDTLGVAGDAVIALTGLSTLGAMRLPLP